MKTLTFVICFGVLLASFLSAGCESELPAPKSRGQTAAARNTTAVVPGAPDQAAPPKSGQGKKVKLSKTAGDSVYLEILPDMKRLVLLESKVCRREGMLEHLLCKTMTKEHEAILHSDVDAAIIHAGLLAAGAQAGHPVEYQPKYKQAQGTMIKVWVQYKDKNGKIVTERGQNWIRDITTKKEMAYEWVFAGSHREPDPVDATKPGFYQANRGDVICIANFPTSLLDVPVLNEKDNIRVDFEPITERIPPLETPVLVILEPVPKKN